MINPARRYLLSIAWLIGSWCASESSLAIAQTIVWTDINSRRIQRQEAGGGSVSTVVQFPPGQSAQGIHYEPLLRKLYYVLFSDSGSVLRRINVDGSDTEVVPITNVSSSFAFNIASRKLYWITSDTLDTINWSELDGSGVDSHTYSTCCIFSILSMGNDLFFGAGLAMQKGVWHAASDGSNEHFVRASGAPVDLAYEPVDGVLYFATAERIYRMYPDGTELEVVVHLPAWQQLLSGPEAIEIDHQGRKLYWMDRTARVIQRSNLDGSNIEDFVTANVAGNPSLELRGLTIVQAPSIPAVANSGMIGCFFLMLLAGSYLAVRRVRHQGLIDRRKLQNGSYPISS